MISPCTYTGKILQEDTWSRQLSKYSNREAILKQTGHPSASCIVLCSHQTSFRAQMYVHFSKHLLSTYRALRIILGLWGRQGAWNLIEPTTTVSWMNRVRPWTNLRRKDFWRGAWLIEKSSSIWICLTIFPWTSHFLGKHVFPWEELIAGWLAKRKFPGEERARLALCWWRSLHLSPWSGVVFPVFCQVSIQQLHMRTVLFIMETCSMHFMWI